MADFLVIGIKSLHCWECKCFDMEGKKKRNKMYRLSVRRKMFRNTQKVQCVVVGKCDSTVK